MRISITLIISLLTLNSFAQKSSVTVSTGAGYANEIWYNLNTETKTSMTVADWDLYFSMSNQSSAIGVNEASGAKAYLPSNSDTSNFANLDTTGMSSWTQLYNSDTSWFIGALDKAATPGDDFDLGWGRYNMVTHQVEGQRIFLIQLGSGEYYKLWIKSLAGGTYNFRFASLDNSVDETRSVTKSGYPTKLLVRYNLRTKTVLDAEPAKDAWELNFGRYMDNKINYLVSGIRINDGLESAKAYPVENKEDYREVGAWPSTTQINGIGSDWKSFNRTAMRYEIQDSTVYFVKDLDGNTWKLIMTGFGGGSSGDFMFDKEKVEATSVEELGNVQLLRVYPNPISGGVINLIMDNSDEASVKLISINGSVVLERQVTNTGLHTETISTTDLSEGLYILHVESAGSLITKKVVVQ